MSAPIFEKTDAINTLISKLNALADLSENSELKLKNIDEVLEILQQDYMVVDLSKLRIFSSVSDMKAAKIMVAENKCMCFGDLIEDDGNFKYFHVIDDETLKIDEDKILGFDNYPKLRAKLIVNESITSSLINDIKDIKNNSILRLNGKAAENGALTLSAADIPMAVNQTSTKLSAEIDSLSKKVSAAVDSVTADATTISILSKNQDAIKKTIENTDQKLNVISTELEVLSEAMKQIVSITAIDNYTVPTDGWESGAEGELKNLYYLAVNYNGVPAESASSKVEISINPSPQSIVAIVNQGIWMVGMSTSSSGVFYIVAPEVPKQNLTVSIAITERIPISDGR